MSGYLDVKYPLKTNLGLNPFKSWRRQWCILRPSPTSPGGCLAVYCSEAGAAAGVIDLPASSVVRRAKSRSRPYAFGVFGVDDRKPRALLAAQSLVDAHNWMEKIRAFLTADQLLGTELLLKDSFSISFIPTDLAQSTGLNGNGTLSVTNTGLRITRDQQSMFIEWKYIHDVSVTSEDKDRICIVNVDSDYQNGGGELKFGTPLAEQICSAIRARRGAGGDKLSRSDGDLRNTKNELEERRTSWYSGPSEVSLDDIDLVMSKESKRIPSGQLARCPGEGHLAPSGRPRCNTVTNPPAHNDSMCDRRSLASVASGIYEEIPDLPEHDTSNTYCTMTNTIAAHTAKDEGATFGVNGSAGRFAWLEEPTYESVSECVFATMPRAPRAHRNIAPPLPPRQALRTKMGESWNSRLNKAPSSVSSVSEVSRHSSLGSLPRCYSVSSARSLPNKTGFSVFSLPKGKDEAEDESPRRSRRKRLKSDSRIVTSPKSDTAKENKDVETKKKKFDFTPTRDIFKNFKVSRKMKNLKITTNLSKGETKSCEFLDETEHVSTKRCSKSVECLEDSNEFIDDEPDLSIEFNDDAVSALSLPQEIVDLILRSREQINKICLKEAEVECEYMPMSPVVPPAPIEHHYIVMSPKTNLA